MTKPHSSLRPSSNLLLLTLWVALAAVLSALTTPFPIVPIVAGALLGLGGGYLQRLSFQENPQSFLNTETALDVRRAIRSTKWGRIYFYLLWCAAALLVIISFLSSKKPGLAFLAAYFTMMSVRELITLKTTYDLQQMQKAG